MKNSRLEIRIDEDTKRDLQILAVHLTPTGSVSELLYNTIVNIIDTNKMLLDKPIIS